MRRAFVHGHMKDVATQFAGGTVKDQLKPAILARPLQHELSNVAQTLADLQDHRHAADYDIARRFTRFEVLGYHADAEQAFADWDAVRGSLQADAFLVALLTWGHLRH